MAARYNEIDPYAAQWLRNLGTAGHIAPGIVDTRSIVDVQPDDLMGHDQVHLFAGIGGWSLAARLAGWPDDKPLWTASCPCQPFSAAGKRKGTADERHLWPEARRLIAACRPPVVAGEQVASKAGRLWLAGVRSDLEELGYTVWAADLCSAGVGAPHIRQRIWWLAESDRGQCRRIADGEGRQPDGLPAGWHESNGEPQRSGSTGRLADSDGGLTRHGHLQSGGEHGQQPEDGRAGGVGHAQEQRRDGWQQRRTEPGERRAIGGCGEDIDRLVDSQQPRLEGFAGYGHNSGQPGWLDEESHRPVAAASPVGFWSNYNIVHCTDGKARRFESVSQPLADGLSAGMGRLRTIEDVYPLSTTARDRVGRLRGYGNAINPWLAAEILRAYLDGPPAASHPMRDR